MYLAVKTYQALLITHFICQCACQQYTGLSLDVQNGQSVTIASNITFKPEGPLRHLTFGNGLSEDRTYNLNYQPESIYVGNVLNRSYEYSPDGNIINARDNLNPAYGHAASYDAIDRMVQSTGWYGVYSFTYDASGNRTSVTRAGTKDTYSISTSNNYLTKTSVSAASYTYDATGNITKRGSDVFTYNGYGQLAGTTVNGISAQYKYNLSGLRVSKTASGKTTLYFYDNDGRLLSEVDAGTGAVNREYIWLGTKPVAYLSGEQVYFIHTDNTETPQLLTNAQGNVVWTIQTYPFGKQSYAGSVTFNLRYPGQYFDEESGLHYNWHRYYDPNTGRYMSSDPIGLAGGLNTFAYVGNNPLSFVDPLGLDAEDGLRAKPISIAPENVISEINESGGPGESPYQNLQVLDFSGVIASAGDSNFSCLESGKIPLINGRLPINSKYAGQLHPSGVMFTKSGFPDFTPYAKAKVNISNLSGYYAKDSFFANKAIGLMNTPENYVWHHVENGKTMLLVPKSIHNAVRHTGGSAIIRNGGFDK